ncbi:MAG TPA: SDR family NAD(P)-dependent oxidoreductase [Polyangiaceae bacterium]|nr:SDR family NAD(P)-dependent oxidoreductase [Polyangiaceae bacterium]
MSMITAVTGAAGALGSELVRVLLERGHRVAALDLPSNRLEALARPGACVPVGLNLTSASAWEEAVQTIRKELGVPTGAVLTAGGWAGNEPADRVKDDGIWRRMLDSNLETAERSMVALLPGMVAAKHGSIVVIGSRAVERPWENTGAAAYVAAKTAVVAYAQTVAAELLDSGVRVNAVLPSVIDTPSNRTAMPKADPLRWVTPESLARIIAFLLSDDAKDVSGAAIPVYARVP